MARYEIDNDPGPVNFEEKDPVLRTLQNAKNLLMCRMGEVPYDRFRGFDPALLELPVSRLREALLPEIDRAMRWEPDVQAVEAEARLREDGTVYIRAVLELPF